MFSSVFQIISKILETDYSAPWQSGKLVQVCGTGVAVQVGHKHYILTNQHCIRNAVHIECRSPFSDKLFLLKVVDSSPELDLALLDSASEVSDLWNQIVSVSIGSVPQRGDTVKIVGFPRGGRNACITTGVVSRTTQTLYNSAIPNLAIQIDAAINPGNSGGPVYNDTGDMVGLAMASKTGLRLQNICYMIHTELITMFLDGVVKFGKFPGICDLDIDAVSLDNPGMRKYLGVNNASGMLITRVHPFGSAAQVLKPNDILCAIDDTVIGNDANIVMGTERVPYWSYLRLKYPGETVQLKIIRAGQVLYQECELKTMQPKLVPALDAHISRAYYTYAGLIFMPLNMHYLIGDGGIDADKAKFVQYMHKYPQQPGEQIVVLRNIISAPINMGYEHGDVKLVSIDNQPIHNLADVRRLCESESDDPFIKFELEDGSIIVIDRVSAKFTTAALARKFLEAPYASDF